METDDIVSTLQQLDIGQKEIQEEQRRQGQVLVHIQAVLESLREQKANPCHQVYAESPQTIRATCTSSSNVQRAVTAGSGLSTESGAPADVAQAKALTRRISIDRMVESVHAVDSLEKKGWKVQCPNGSAMSGLLRQMAHGEQLDYVIGVAIAMNCMCIGAEIQLSVMELNEPSAEGSWRAFSIVLNFLEHLFLVCYLVEMLLRFHSLGVRTYFQSRWRIFDFVLVVIGILAQWVIAPIVFITDASMDSSILEKIVLLRILRLLRLFRVFRLIAMFHDLWRLVNGLMQSCSAILSTFALLMLSVYVFACIGLELITKSADLMSDPELEMIINKHFSSLFVAALTLARFISFDSTAAIYEPLVLKNTGSFHSLALFVYIVTIAMVVSISLMNLVTAILVDSAINQTREDRELGHRRLEKKVRSLLPQLESFFDDLDTDDDDRIVTADVLECYIQVPLDIKVVLDEISLVEIFETIDADSRGWLDKSEFTEGFLNICLSESPPMMTRVMHHLQLLHHGMRQLQYGQGAGGWQQGGTPDCSACISTEIPPADSSTLPNEVSSASPTDCEPASNHGLREAAAAPPGFVGDA